MSVKDISKLTDELIEKTASIKKKEEPSKKVAPKRTKEADEKLTMKVKFAEALRKTASDLRKVDSGNLTYEDVFNYINRFDNEK